MFVITIIPRLIFAHIWVSVYVIFFYYVLCVAANSYAENILLNYNDSLYDTNLYDSDSFLY